MRSRAFLALALCLFAVGLQGAPQRHHRRPKSNKSPAELRKELRGIQAKKDKIQRELDKNKKQAHQTLAAIHQVDSKLTELEDKHATTLDRLDASRSQQKVVGQDLQNTTKRLEQVREEVRERLRVIYMQGNPSAISAFIGSKTVGNIAERKYLVERIARKDRQLFEDFRTLKQQKEDQKRAADELVLRVQGLEREQRGQESELRTVRGEKQQYLGELQSEQSKLRAALQQFEEDEQQITAEIQAFSNSHSSGPIYKGELMAPVSGRITSGFGMRYHPILHITRLHAGVDFHATTGTPIHAAGDGVVVAAQQMRGYGNVVIIDHGGGLSTVYGHCSRIFVSAGQRIRRGDKIAAVGMTGLATAPHLHFEVRVHGHPINPITKLGRRP